MPYCGDTSLVKHYSDSRTVQLIRCRSWRCPDCVDHRTRRLMAEANGGSPNTFLTLTIRATPGMDMDEAAKRLSHAWRKLRLRAMRKYKLDHLPFLAVFEATKAGAPHLHILLRSKWLDQHWLSVQMTELLDSPHVDIRRIDNKGRVAAYVAKYCGKAPHHFGNCKRYWKSKDYEQRPDRLNKAPDPNRRPGERILEPFDRIVARWRSFGWHVTVERPGFARALDTHTVPP